MLYLTASEATPALRALLDPDMPTMLRAFGVLDGHISGQIITDDRVRPAWVAVREATFGTLYLGGAFDRPLVQQLIDGLRATGDVAIGRWPDDALLQLLPPQPDYDGRTLYFTCARLIQACEELGHATWWDCAKQNLASVALARKLGYRTEREYRVLAWCQRPGSN
jgi:hypothetical protein